MTQLSITVVDKRLVYAKDTFTPYLSVTFQFPIEPAQDLAATLSTEDFERAIGADIVKLLQPKALDELRPKPYIDKCCGAKE